MPNALYIPLDNRPVCYTRVVLLLESCGFNVIIPPESLFKTTLDNQPYENFPHGDVDKLKNFYINLDHDKIDCYIISIDQITSGGLVNSRLDEDYTIENNINIINTYLNKEIIKNKKVILIDSLDRLAITCGYNNYNLKDYQATRAFGSIPRKGIDFSSNDENEILSQIFTSYNLDENNKIININKCNLTPELKTKYLNNRTRKLLLNIYIIHYIQGLINEGYDIYYMLGIDDSIPHNTIQTNEINYLKRIINDSWGLIFIGIDELPLMACSRLCKVIYNDNQPAKLQLYYLGNHENEVGDPYDVGTIKEDMDVHLKVLQSEIDNTNPDIHVVMLTYDKDKDIHQKNMIDGINLINNLLNNNKLVIVMDLVNSSWIGEFETLLVKNVKLGNLLSYSNWNTTANKIGISLSIGLARYYYLKNNQSTNITNLAWGKLLSLIYLKDFNYKAWGIGLELNKYLINITNDKEAYLNYYKYKDITCDLNDYCQNISNDNNLLIINNLKNSELINDLKKHKKLIIQELSVLKYNFIWYRTFETDINFNIKIDEE